MSETDPDVMRVTKTLKLRLLAPRGSKYAGDHKFQVLRVIRDVTHRMMNAAISEAHRAPLKQSSRSDNMTRDTTVVAAAMRTALDHDREYALKDVDRLETSIAKLDYNIGRAKRKAGPDLEDLQAERARLFRYLERARLRASLQLSPTVIDTMRLKAMQDYNVYAKDKGRGTRSLQLYRHGFPILLRTGSGAWTLQKDDRGYVFTCTLDNDRPRHPNRHSFVAIPDGPNAHMLAHRVTDEKEAHRLACKPLSASISMELRKNRRLREAGGGADWFAHVTISYLIRKPSSVDSAEKMAVRIGMSAGDGRNKAPQVICAVDTRGGCFNETGERLLAFIQRMDSRTAKLGHASRKTSRGSGALNRGEHRRRKMWRDLVVSRSDGVDTWMRQVADRFVRMAVRRGIGTIILVGSDLNDRGPAAHENIARFLRVVPTAKANEFLKQAAQAKGLAVEELEPSADHAKRCPSCGHVHKSPQRDVFVCAGCKMARGVQTVLAWNALLAVSDRARAAFEKDEAWRVEVNRRVAAAADLQEGMHEHQDDKA